MDGGAQNDPVVIRREYADESGLAGRASLWTCRLGPQPQDVAFDEVLAASPGRIVEVGCGRGEFAHRLARAGIEVVALDQSARMVELTKARGVNAQVGDVQDLPFEDDTFDAAVANFMLYHVADLDRGLCELARVIRSRGILVAATNSQRQLAELWELVGRNLSDREDGFTRENGDQRLRRHFSKARRVDLDTTLQLTARQVRDYVSHSIRHQHLADLVPEFAGSIDVTVSDCVFVATA
jgi:ubiquinone/menaquinone biosynthesis C-methylase UbiE